MKAIHPSDLEFIASRLPLDSLKEKKLFITGGTGLFGKWLIESLLYANKKHDLNLNIQLLTRYPDVFLTQFPHYAKNNNLILIKGDIRNLACSDETIDYILHAATDSGAHLNTNEPFEMMDTIIRGTNNIINLAQKNPTCSVLNVSSGAIYGPQPPNISHVSETYLGHPDPLNINNAYTEGKRCSELLSAHACRTKGVNIKIARCFAFVGPHLPLNSHFAIGNFISHALKGEDLIIKGDGRAVRSYMYMADLVVWLMKILVLGKPSEVYNVGSDQEITISELADVVIRRANASSLLPHLPKKINKKILGKLNPNTPAHMYVPNIDKAKTDLQLNCEISLDQAIDKTIAWHLS